MSGTCLKHYAFWIRRKHESVFEKIELIALSEEKALNKLPECVTWHFAANGNPKTRRV